MKTQYRQRLIVLNRKYKQEILDIVKTFTSEVKVIGSIIYVNLDSMSLFRLEYNALSTYCIYFRLLPV